MARRSSSSELGVSLFPFLAVLVCVMGSLIFLLLATTTRMHETAVAEAEAAQFAMRNPTAPPPPDDVPAAIDVPEVPFPVANLGKPIELKPLQPEPLVDPSVAERELQHRREQLEQEWREKLAQLIHRRDRLKEAWQQQHTLQQAAKVSLSELETTIGKTQTRLRGVLADVEALEQDKVPPEDLAAAEDEIIELRRKLRLLKSRPTEEESKFAVIPFDVRSGTTRRPILIECTDRGLRFLPEEIVVTPADLEGFSDRYNPLLAGATALVNYWTAWNRQQKHPGEEPEPYVLLIVRPNGTVAYYVAMKMLSALKTPFGYELVDENVALAPPPRDPLAADLCQEAIEQLLAERSKVTQHARDGFRTHGGRSKPGKPARASKDTFEVADVLPPSEDVGERSWENPSRFERRKGGSPDTVAETKPAGAKPPEEAFPPSGPHSPLRMSPAGRRSAPQSTSKTSAAPPRELAPPESDEATAISSLPQRPIESRSAAQRVPRKQSQGEFRLEHLARRHWGESEPNASIGIEQNVSVRIDAERIVVAENRPVRYEADDQPLQVFLRVMEAVDQESATWGKPRSGFYWTPRLRFVISPGGNQMFERLDPLTVRSGLSSTKEFTLEGIQPATQEVVP